MCNGKVETIDLQGLFKCGIQLWAIFGPSFALYGMECWKNSEGEMVSSLTCVQWKG